MAWNHPLSPVFWLEISFEPILLLPVGRNGTKQLYNQTKTPFLNV
jgi:hypothetical protein